MPSLSSFKPSWSAELFIEFDADGTPKDKFLRVESLHQIACKMRISRCALTKWDTLCIEPVAALGAKILELGLGGHGKPLDPLVTEIDISNSILNAGGAFRYYLRHRSGMACAQCGYLQVARKLHANQTSTLQPSQLCLQTILCKWTTPSEFMGSIVPSLSSIGYNMIHMAPVQERGCSDSPYSIRDQLRLSEDFDDCTSDSRDNEVRLRNLRQMIGKCHELGILAIVDVVWNHTACDTEWLAEHPEAGYNLQTAPHLRAAYELDEAVLLLSRKLGRDSSGHISCEGDLDRIMIEFTDALDSLKLYEYYCIDIESHLLRFDGLAFKGPRRAGTDAFSLQFDDRYERFSYFLNMDSVNDFYTSIKDPTFDKLADFKSKLEQINASQVAEFNAAIREAIICNVKARIHYERLSADGPKLGHVSIKSPLLSPYFTRIFPTHDARIAPIAFANNGWVWDADPLINFAEAPGLAYLRREIIIWGDCVKLRYGRRYGDSPWLWDHMIKYTRCMARTFDGFRIDNCHSTPLHVAERLVAEARDINPDLYMVAELFTGRPERDLLFVGELGIDSLIREAMVCASAHELSLNIDKYKSGVITSTPHALFMDCTHDNPAPAQKRTLYDALPNAAITAMTPCAVGSVRGYDQAVPHHLNIVSETRKYSLDDQSETPIGSLKRLLYHLRRQYVDVQLIRASEECTAISALARDNTEIVCYAKSSFTVDEASCFIQRSTANEKVLFSGTMVVDSEYVFDKDRITGTATRLDELQTNAGGMIKIDPGSVRIIQMPLVNNDADVLESLGAYYDDPANWAFVDRLSLHELNMLLFRTDAEERDMDPSYGAYTIPDFGPLPYCGIAGFVLPLLQLSHGAFFHEDNPFTRNTRQGDWMLKYTVGRLNARRFPAEAVQRISTLFTTIGQLTRIEKPRQIFFAFYFIYNQCMSALQQRLNACGGDLELRLAAGLVQMLGVVQSTGYDAVKCTSSLAAGFPHFATHHMRCWGRDTFISYRGLFLLSNQLEEGSKVICAFASCLYNGLIPNLLDSLRFPRFNARDAVWFFVKAVLEHALIDKSILDMPTRMRFPSNTYTDYSEWLLQKPPFESMTIKEVVIEILRKHVEGIDFVEHNAGPTLDAHMAPEGFHIVVKVDRTTGLIHGGNAHNCGTWMDKMGSVAGVNRGRPATPRDGAAIEINALCLYSLDLCLQLIGNHTLADGFGLEEWSSVLSKNFEKQFYSPHLGYFKDCVGSSDGACDTQLRPNQLIAVCLLNKLLDKRQVANALGVIRKQLIGDKSIGMRTLSPADPLYNPNYDLNDGTGGHNYHNGPEWPWLTGFYLRSLILAEQDLAHVHQILLRIHQHITDSAWGAVAELTNENGRHCRHACAVQAWSMACLREAVHLLQNRSEGDHGH